jgi:hypothetical protein
MEKMKKEFLEMLEQGLEEQIRLTAKEGDISNWENATILPVIGFIPNKTEVFIAGAYLLGQNEGGEARLLCVEPCEEELATGVMEWVQNIMLLEGLNEVENICELLLDFQMAVVATDFDFVTAEKEGWEDLFTQVRERKRSTNRRALSKVAEMGQFRDALKGLLNTFLGDLAEGLDHWTQQLNPGQKSVYVSLNDPTTDGGFDSEFSEEWE